MGIQGIIRGKPHRTTIPDKKAPCPVDKVNRQFRVPAPNMLWVSDFTYVATNLRHFSVTSVGQLAIFAGGSSYAVATIYARVVLRGIRPEVAAASMFTSAALVLSCLAIWQDGMPEFAFRPTTWVALGFLAALSSALAYILLYEFLDRAGAGNMNLSTLLNGPVAVVLGAALFGEVLSANVYLGLALIATGLVLVDGRILGLIARRG